MKIIIVDDEMSALHTFLTDVIERSDIDYKFFKDDRQEIAEYVQKNDVSAAFLDVCMPKIDGVQLAGELISYSPDIEIVFITAMDITKDDLPADIAAHTKGFLYKPYEANDLLYFLSSIDREAPRLKAKMFGSFDCFLNGNLIRFSSSKSKELFALLLTYNGKALTMSDAISQLWPDMDLDKSKPLYRDAVWRLRKTLQNISFNCVNFERAQLILDKQNISCDYWDYLDGALPAPTGCFLKSYGWSNEYL